MMFCTMKELSLYIHVPFCARKCHYCHFYSLRHTKEQAEAYLRALEQEWYLYRDALQHHSIVSLYFGGGTPILLKPSGIETILSFIRRDVDITASEITIEANPDHITAADMQAYSSLGINRVSIGVQSFDDPLLHLLGRTHDAQQACAAIHHTHDAGISNISIDLMYDLPHQELTTWESTLAQATSLPITHLSLYNLTIEPETAFSHRKEEIEKAMPGEEKSTAMYIKAIEELTKAGFSHYEISAFCREGLVSQHNTGYWKGRPFYGLGPSAFSYTDGSRHQNISDLKAYCDTLATGGSPISFREKLSDDDSRHELLAINLRLLEGVNLSSFEEGFGALGKTCHEAIKSLVAEGLLTMNKGTIALTDKGILFYDSVAAEIV
jgi:oxygen-independent coproporphyrinogen III oxidase